MKASLLSFSILFITAIILNSHSASALCTVVKKANLRVGPGTGYEKTLDVETHMPFRFIKKKGKWFKIMDVDGETHWIHSNLVTSRKNCAVVKVQGTVLRTEVCCCPTVFIGFQI